MGGLSSEREVSLNSGNACYDAIDKEKYYATKIIVDKNFYDQILTIKPDICFNALHGCLLYTSPSPRDRTRSRMPSSA